MNETDKYPAEQAGRGLAEGMNAQVIGKRRIDTTLRENLEMQITEAKDRVAALEATRDRMEKSGILDARIDDIQAAMRW